MTYKVSPLNNNVLVSPLTTKETKEYTSKVLTDVESDKLNVLNYGRVIEVFDPINARFETGDIVLYQKLAAHKTNFGTPRQILVPSENIEGKLEVDNDQAN